MNGALHAVVSGWLLGPASGANRRLLALLRALPAQLASGERVTVLHATSFVPPEELCVPGLAWRAVDVPAGPTARRAARERSLLPNLLRELGATVYDHGFLPLPPTGAVPTCLLLHDLRAADGQTRWPRWLAREVLRRSCRRADAIVVPSHWTATRLAQLAPRAPAAHVVPNATDPVPDPVPEITSTATAPTTAGYVLHVGHVEARKNLGVVVEALARIEAAARPELWLAGRDAGALDDLRRLAARRGVADHLRPLGVVSDERLHTLYTNARAVVVPSRYEGFGLPALEALAHGRPVLAADATSLPEVVGDAGVLLPPDQPQAWAEALRTAWPDDDQSVAARRRHASRFVWRGSAAALLAVWRVLHSR